MATSIKERIRKRRIRRIITLVCSAVLVLILFGFFIIPSITSGIMKLANYNPNKDAVVSQIYDIVFELFAPSADCELSNDFIDEKYGKYSTTLNVTQDVGYTPPKTASFDVKYIRGKTEISGEDGNFYAMPSQRTFLDRRVGDIYWEILRDAPLGTKAIAWIAFEEGKTVEEAMEYAGSLYGVETVWLAVKTSDNTDSANEPILGFTGLPVNKPSNIDAIPESKRKYQNLALSDVDTPAYRAIHFMGALEFLKDRNEEVQAIIKSPALGIEGEVDFEKIIKYIKEKQDGKIVITGIVLRGFTKEILKLQDRDGLRCTMVEEIVIW